MGNVPCLTFKTEADNQSETRARTTDNVTADLLEKRLLLFGHDAALDICYKFLDYTLCGNDGTTVESNIALAARPEAWVATLVTFLVVWKRRGGQQQKLYADTYATYVLVTIRQEIRRVGSLSKV